MLKYLPLALALLAQPAAAQITPQTPKQERAANRQALREARRTDSPYKESHLTVTSKQLERGSTAGPPGAANQPPPPPDPRPLRRAKLRRNRRQTEPTP